MPQWRFGERKTYCFCAGVIACLAVLLGIAAAAEIARPASFDFFAMWSFARFALTHEPVQIYDYGGVRAFQLQLDPGMTGVLPFAYPPTFLLALLPFGLPPIAVSWCLWTGLGLTAFVLAACIGRWRGAELLLLGLAPATIVTAVTGQNGFFSAALMIGGARLMHTRPALAGFLFGLLSFKPQIGLLVPVVLAAGRIWRCFTAAAITAAGSAAAATYVLGWSMWPAWIVALRAQWHTHVADPTHTHASLPTVSAGLRLMGFAAEWAQVAQGVAAILVASLVWVCVRRNPGARSLAVLLVGSFLVTPYAFAYDMPALTVAILLVLREVAEAGAMLRSDEAIALCLGLFTPYVTMLEWYIPIPLAAASLAFLFMVLVRRCLHAHVQESLDGTAVGDARRLVTSAPAQP